MNKILSICIPTYNRDQYLVLALDSILPQVTSAVEIIISDNGSTDKTQACLDAYKSKYSFIKTCGFSSNMGIDRNIENCFLHATGDYVFLFSDDDVLMPGSIAQILETIKAKEPSVICLNHFAFKNHSLVNRLPPMLPDKIINYQSGKHFFKFCGLGFLSSLIVDRYEALKYLPTIKKGRECAHLDVVARVALTGHGPFIFLGKIHVAARSIDPPRYSAINSSILYQKSFYEDLLDEGLIDSKMFHFFIKRLIYRDLPRILFRMLRSQGTLDSKDYENLLVKAFGDYIGFRIVIGSFFHLNKKLLHLIYHLIFLLLKTYRKAKVLFSS